MKDKFLAIVAAGAILFILSRISLEVKFSSGSEEKDPEKETQQHLYGFLCKLQNLGADKNFFSKDYYKKAESAYFVYTNNKTNENAQECLKYLNACQERFEFFGG